MERKVFLSVISIAYYICNGFIVTPLHVRQHRSCHRALTTDDVEPRASPYRWDQPCAGSKPSVYRQGLGKQLAFLLISNRIKLMRQRVNTLRKKFENRFSNQNHVDNLNRQSILKGLQVLNLWKKKKIRDNIMDIYQQLSHLAVFLHEAQKDKKRQEHDGGYCCEVYGTGRGHLLGVMSIKTNHALP